MTGKSPFDVSEMMKMFDPQAVMESNRKNYEAALTANKAVADAYKDFYLSLIHI